MISIEGSFKKSILALTAVLVFSRAPADAWSQPPHRQINLEAVKVFLAQAGGGGHLAADGGQHGRNVQAGLGVGDAHHGVGRIDAGGGVGLGLARGGERHCEDDQKRRGGVP